MTLVQLGEAISGRAPVRMDWFEPNFTWVIPDADMPLANFLYNMRVAQEYFEIGYSLAIASGELTPDGVRREDDSIIKLLLSTVEYTLYSAWTRGAELPDWNFEAHARDVARTGTKAHKAARWARALRVLYNDPTITVEQGAGWWKHFDSLIPLLVAVTKIQGDHTNSIAVVQQPGDNFLLERTICSKLIAEIGTKRMLIAAEIKRMNTLLGSVELLVRDRLDVLGDATVGVFHKNQYRLTPTYRDAANLTHPTVEYSSGGVLTREQMLPSASRVNIPLEGGKVFQLDTADPSSSTVVRPLGRLRSELSVSPKSRQELKRQLSDLSSYSSTEETDRREQRGIYKIVESYVMSSPPAMSLPFTPSGNTPTNMSPSYYDMELRSPTPEELADAEGVNTTLLQEFLTATGMHLRSTTTRTREFSYAESSMSDSTTDSIRDLIARTPSWSISPQRREGSTARASWVLEAEGNDSIAIDEESATDSDYTE
jgi:hypothetical protein